MSCKSNAHKVGRDLRGAGVPTNGGVSILRGGSPGALRGINPADLISRLSNKTDRELFYMLFEASKGSKFFEVRPEHYPRQSLENTLYWFGNPDYHGKGDNLLRLGSNLPFRTLVDYAQQKQEIYDRYWRFSGRISNLRERMTNPAPDDLEILGLTSSKGNSLAWLHIEEGGMRDEDITFDILNLPAHDGIPGRKGVKIAHVWKGIDAYVRTSSLEKKRQILTIQDASGDTVAHRMLRGEKHSRESGKEPIYQAPIPLDDDSVMLTVGRDGESVAHLAARIGRPVPEKYFDLRNPHNGHTVAHEISRHAPERLTSEQLRYENQYGETPADYAGVAIKLSSEGK